MLLSNATRGMHKCAISIVEQEIHEKIAKCVASADILLPPLENIVVEYSAVSNLDTFLWERHHIFRKLIAKEAGLYLRVSNEYNYRTRRCYNCSMTRPHLDFQFGIEIYLPDMGADIIISIPIGNVFRFIAGDPTIRLEIPNDESDKSRMFAQMCEFSGVSNNEIQMGLDLLLSQWRESAHW